MSPKSLGSISHVHQGERVSNIFEKGRERGPVKSNRNFFATVQYGVLVQRCFHDWTDGDGNLKCLQSQSAVESKNKNIKKLECLHGLALLLLRTCCPVGIKLNNYSIHADTACPQQLPVIVRLDRMSTNWKNNSSIPIVLLMSAQLTQLSE